MKRFFFVTAVVFIAAITTLAAEKNFRVVASTSSPWRERGKLDWVLQVNTQPRGSLTLGHGVSEPEISAEQRKRILDAANANGFFEMPKTMGVSDLDIPTRSLSIVDGARRNSVVFYDSKPFAEMSDEEMENLASLPQFLAIWSTVRSVIENPRAVDERKSDQKLLEEFKKRMDRK